jgi:hypothetical protein
MSEFSMNLNDARFDFSADSKVKDSLLKSILSRQTERAPVSFNDLLGQERGGAVRTGGTCGPVPGITPPDKGRGK